MIAEIITIGNELLHGRMDDTNATHISRRLLGIGIECKYRTTVGDDKGDVVSALEQASKRADVIIATGGLGPTPDDVTIEAAAEFFGLGLEPVPEVENRIRAFYKIIGLECSENVMRQARVPQGADVIMNNIGTAPGVRMNFEGKQFLFFPGVPREMAAMLDGALEKLAESGGQTKILSRLLG